MRTKYNKNGTVSITGMSKELYCAIQDIVMSAENCFEYQECKDEYYSNDGFICTLTKERIDELNKIKWVI